jgi:hypothetical protein
VLSGAPALPKLFDRDAARRLIEFFTTNIRNPNTRPAYARAAVELALWCERNDIHELQDIEPLHVATYIEILQTRLAPPSVAARCSPPKMHSDTLNILHHEYRLETIAP